MVLLLVGSLAIASCADSAPPPAPPEAAQGESQPQPAPPSASEAELPESVETSIVQDIASRDDVPAEALEIAAAQPQAWPDGCLGLGNPDEICTMAIVNGWEVTVTQGNQRWVYRTDSDGTLVKRADETN